MPRFLERAEHVFEVHDGRRGQVAALAEAGFQQVAREGSLRLGHLLDGETIAWKDVGRDEVPLQALAGVERKGHLLALLGRQRPKKPGASQRHGARGAFRGHYAADKHRDEPQGDGQPERHESAHHLSSFSTGRGVRVDVVSGFSRTSSSDSPGLYPHGLAWI